MINKIIKKGSILAYMLVIMGIVSILLVSSMRYITSQIKFSFYRVERENAFQIAEAGVYFYRWYLAHEISGKTAQQIKDFWENGNPFGVDSPYENELSDPEGGAIGRYSIEVQPPDPSSTIIIVESTGWTYRNPDSKRTVRVRFRRPSWSEYAVLANDFMRFGSGTEVFGKVHSNKGIRFDGLIHNVISSSVNVYDDPDHTGANEFGVHTHNPLDPLPPSSVPSKPSVFEAGRQFPVPEVDFNGVTSDLNFMKNEAQTSSNGVYFDNSRCSGSTIYGRHIILNGTTMTVRKVTGYNSTSKAITSEGCSSNYNIPNGGIIFIENNAWVEGSVNGRKITITAANLSGGPSADIYIGTNNLLYTNFDGTDIIGLVAQNNISVVRNSLNVLTIDAALLAQSGRVGRDYYSSTYNKNTITVNGSIATNQRYGFAYSDGTGYQNRILNFDNNLLYFPPPFFPTGTEYSIDLWEETRN